MVHKYILYRGEKRSALEKKNARSVNCKKTKNIHVLIKKKYALLYWKKGMHF